VLFSGRRRCARSSATEAADAEGVGSLGEMASDKHGNPSPYQHSFLDSPDNWHALEETLRRHARIGGALAPGDIPLGRCLEVARSNGAKTAIVESDYFDRDYLSELMAFHAKTFDDLPHRAQRIHFFSERIRERRIWRLSDDQRASYLGYIILRPRLGASVGRTMLKPPKGLEEVTTTSVVDTVHLFGQRLHVSAVPFMQQDARLLTCSHIAAWICHYTAVLDGLDVARRPVAEFNLMANPSIGLGRSIPSVGLSHYQITDLLRLFGLPPVFYDIKQLNDGDRPPQWPDRTEGNHARVARICCRYINSGLPVIVVLSDEEHPNRAAHAAVVCGYARNHSKGNGSDTSLLIHDDQRGPYLWIHHVDQHTVAETRYGWKLLIAPLPDGLWLTGESAERWGAGWLLESALSVTEPPKGGIRIPEAKMLLDEKEAGEMTLRSYAISSSRFKRRVAKNCGDNRTVEEYMYLAMPKYVWVVEAVSRSLRNQGKRAVLGEVIFDATSDEERPTVLAVRLPGVLSIPRPGKRAWEGRVGHNPSASCGRQAELLN
jgi:hypothetical protein